MSPAADAPLAAWLDYIERLHPQNIAMGLERVGVVKQRLGIAFTCPVITVGGTNGKGSTCAMLEAILRAGAFRTGMYTSPHLIKFNERARIDGKDVADAPLVAALARVEAARAPAGAADEAVELTYFEFSTLAVLLLFMEANLDCVILEVGLGGRLDAVNLIDTDCAILTSVDLDHQSYLGDTREQIGWEKAHIFRAGVPAICADPHPPASVRNVADEIGARLLLLARDFGYAGDQQQWKFWFMPEAQKGLRDPVTRNGLSYPGLRGANQLLNASAALAALECLRPRLPVAMQAIRQGLIGVEWPGRFQLLPGRPVVVLDVAHNPHAAAVLADNLGNIGFASYTHAVFGMLGDKDIAGVVELVKGRIDYWHLTSLPGPRGTSADQLAEVLAAAGINEGVFLHASPAEAFAAARGQAGENDRIVVFGSFLTVTDVMQSLNRRPTVH